MKITILDVSLVKNRHKHSKILKVLSLSLSFQFFEYLSLSLSILQISCEFRKRKDKIKKKNYFLSINFDFFLIFKIDTQIHTENFFFFFNFFSKFARDLQNTETQNQILKKLKITQT